MSSVRLVTLVMVGLAVLLVVVQNRAPMQAKFLWFRAEMPAFVLLSLTAAGGFVLGLLVAWRLWSGARSKP